METTRAILDHAMNMPPADKFVIIEGLLNSLDEPDKTIDEIWAIEAEKRLKAYKEGNLKTLSYKVERGQPKNSPLLADRLLNSLDSPRRREISLLWADEAERRVQQIKNGEVIPLPGKEVIQDIRKTLNL